MTEQLLPQLQMDLDSLEQLPEAEVTKGYRLRTYRCGDEAAWCRLINECIGGEYNEESCRSSLTGTEEFSPQDLLFAECSGEEVGTACARRGANTPAGVGYVHMVAVAPRHRGKRLGRALVVAVLRRFRELGYRAATLQTDDFRLSAIRLYLDLNFHPTMTDESHPARWEAVLSRLGQ
jgi:mycothiol synthase